MPAIATSSESTACRDRSIRLAVATSFLSKAGTILLQLVSIPIAIRVLGREEFGLYTTVSLTLTTISLLEVGVGPALAHGLSKARATDDQAAQRELGSTAFFLMAGVALLAGLVLGGILLAVPLPAIYGDTFAGRESELRPALWAGLFLFLILFTLNLTERIREGYLEVASNNLWGAAGNVIAAVSVGALVGVFPQVWFMVVAIHGAIAITRGCNTVALWRKHPLIIPSLKHFRGGMARHLFSDGMAFTACCLVTGVVEYNFCGWLVGRLNGPSDVALYGIFISMTVMQLGFVIMLSTPTWPAVAEALARGDIAWVKMAAKRLYLYGCGFGICAALGLVLLGPWLLPIWLGKEFSGMDRGLLACYGAYSIAHIWRHLNHAMMIGSGQVTKLARIQLAESTLVAVVAWFALDHGSVGTMLLAMALTITGITGWVLPLRVWKILARAETPH